MLLFTTWPRRCLFIYEIEGFEAGHGAVQRNSLVELMLSAFILGLGLGEGGFDPAFDRARSLLHTLGLGQWPWAGSPSHLPLSRLVSLDRGTLCTFARNAEGYTVHIAHTACAGRNAPATFAPGYATLSPRPSEERIGGGAIGAVYACNPPAPIGVVLEVGASPADGLS